MCARLPSLLTACRTDYLEAILILLVVLLFIVLILVGLHSPLEVLDPFFERQHAPEAGFVVLGPTLRTPHERHVSLVAGPKGAAADRARYRQFRGITHANV